MSDVSGESLRSLRTAVGDPMRLRTVLSRTVVVDDAGLLPAVVQDSSSREVLMVAWMDVEALARTLETRRGTYWSRSRGEYWVKGETSGHTQRVTAVSVDCDADTVLVEVEQTGPACHTGTMTCFTERHIDADHNS